MTTSIGYALGAGSGLDIKTLVDDLANAAKAPKEALIAKREKANQAKVSTLAQVSGAIDSFASALSSLISGGTPVQPAERVRSQRLHRLGASPARGSASFPPSSR